MSMTSRAIFPTDAPTAANSDTSSASPAHTTCHVISGSRSPSSAASAARTRRPVAE
nr:hypothetical protein [Sinomonas mesophila]